jgi:hypothetical protein
MRTPLVALALLAAALPVRAAARSADAAPADSVPASALVVDARALTVKPELTNRPAIHRLLARSYPRALRDQGTTGRVTVTMVIDPAGVPRLVTVTGKRCSRVRRGLGARDPRHALLPARARRRPRVGEGARPGGVQPGAVAFRRGNSGLTQSRRAAGRAAVPPCGSAAFA